MAGFACVGAELRAVAAFVAHLVDVDDLIAAIGQLDHDVRAVRAGIDAVFADGIAVEAASALTAGAGGHLQDALLGNRISLGRISLLGNFIRVRLADDGLRKRSGVRNALDNGSGASVRIACRPDVFHVGLEGRPLRPISMPFSAMSFASTFSPMAEMTRSHGISNVSPVATGLRRPDASGSPSFI